MALCSFSSSLLFPLLFHFRIRITNLICTQFYFFATFSLTSTVFFFAFLPMLWGNFCKNGKKFTQNSLDSFQSFLVLSLGQLVSIPVIQFFDQKEKLLALSPNLIVLSNKLFVSTSTFTLPYFIFTKLVSFNPENRN